MADAPGDYIDDAGTNIVEQLQTRSMVPDAEISQQVATAKRYPRDIRRVIERITTLVTMDTDSAEECVYTLKRGDKPIVGPSIRFAETVASNFGNVLMGARVHDIDPAGKWVSGQGMCWDMENNVRDQQESRRRTTDKRGKPYSYDMVMVTGAAAASIALRNAILRVVPRGIWRPAYDAAEGVLRGDVRTLKERKEIVYKRFAAFGVSQEQICSLLGVSSDSDVTIDHMPILSGWRQALKSGEMSVEDLLGTLATQQKTAVFRDPFSDPAAGQKSDQASKQQTESGTDGSGAAEAGAQTAKVNNPADAAVAHGVAAGDQASPAAATAPAATVTSQPDAGVTSPDTASAPAGATTTEMAPKTAMATDLFSED